MKKYLLTAVMISTAITIVISGCGGGGGGSPTAPTPQPTTAVLKISTNGTLQTGTKIGGVDVSLSLPAGVTVKSQANPPDTDSGVAAASGAAASDSTALATYTPSASTVRILLANSSGFGTGEFVTVNCDISSGSHPTAAGFSLSVFSARDLNGATISGLTAGFTAVIN